MNDRANWPRLILIDMNFIDIWSRVAVRRTSPYYDTNPRTMAYQVANNQKSDVPQISILVRHFIVNMSATKSPKY